MGPAAAMALKWGVPIASSLLGGIGGKGRANSSRQPTRTQYSNQSQVTPWDYDPYAGGNQGQELLAQVLGSWEGLLGNLGPSQQYQQAVRRGLGSFL
jgi:hypothetical protein